MRHQMAYRKLGRTSAHRAAMFRNQLASMIDHERIVTTLIKAKELRPIVEKLVTLGKNDSVHARRQAARSLPENDVLVRKLFEDVSPRFAERPGGYTRIIKLGPRRGDGSEMAILEFVDFEFKAAEPQDTKTKKAAPKKDEAEEEGEAEESAKPRRPAKAKAAPKKKEASGGGSGKSKKKKSDASGAKPKKKKK